MMRIVVWMHMGGRRHNHCWHAGNKLSGRFQNVVLAGSKTMKVSYKSCLVLVLLPGGRLTKTPFLSEVPGGGGVVSFLPKPDLNS